MAKALEQITGFREAREKLSQRTDLAAKTLATLGGTGVTAIGVAKAFDVFPLEGQGLALAAMLIGFLLMAAAVYFLTRRLWRTQEPIIMRSDPQAISELDSTERRLVSEVYTDMSTLNDISSLRAYEGRGQRLAHVADEVEQELGDKLREQAAVIGAEVQAAEARAAFVVTRRRAANAVLGWWSLVWYMAFFVGLLGFGIATDKISAARAADSDKIALAKSCADARTAKALESELPAACGKATPLSEAASEPSASLLAAQAVQALARGRAKCLAAAQSQQPAGSGACAELDKALHSALAP